MLSPPGEKVLSIEQAAARLGVTTARLRRLVRYKLIPAAYVPTGDANIDLGIRESDIQRVLPSLAKARQTPTVDCRRSTIVHVNCDNCGGRPLVLHRPRNEMGGYYCEEVSPTRGGKSGHTLPLASAGEPSNAAAVWAWSGVFALAGPTGVMLALADENLTNRIGRRSGRVSTETAEKRHRFDVGCSSRRRA